MKQFKADSLTVQVFASRAEMGQAAATDLGSKLRELLVQQPYVNMIFAAAPSQNEFLSALILLEGIDWQRVNAFHMDEYIGLPDNAPQRFGNFLKEKILGRLPFGAINYIDGAAVDAEGECERYSELLRKFPADLVCMGIGENGHIAFNDPHVADFNDPRAVKIVDLDEACRRQQVNDGCFATMNDVPTHAITLTIPALISSKFVYCMVPGKNKAKAVLDTSTGPVSEVCPASILRQHAHAVLFIDRDSSSLLKQYI